MSPTIDSSSFLPSLSNAIHECSAWCMAVKSKMAASSSPLWLAAKSRCGSCPSVARLAASLAYSSSAGLEMLSLASRVETSGASYNVTQSITWSGTVPLSLGSCPSVARFPASLGYSSRAGLDMLSLASSVETSGASYSTINHRG